MDDELDDILTVEIRKDKVFIGNEYSSGTTYEIPDTSCPLDGIVQAFSDYIYTYYSDIDDNV